MKFVPLHQGRARFVTRCIVQSALLVALGCTRWSAVPNGTVPRSEVKVLRLQLRDGSSIRLEGAFFSPDSIEGVAPDTTLHGSRIAVARADVVRIDVPHLDVARTTKLLLGITAAGFATVIILFFAAMSQGD